MYQIAELRNENWKTNGELFVCLAQTPAPNPQQIIDGQPHPDTSTFLRSLLNDSPGEDNPSRLELMAPLGEHKAVVLIPEFAISMDGWEAVDGYVRSMRRAGNRQPSPSCGTACDAAFFCRDANQRSGNSSSIRLAG